VIADAVERGIAGYMARMEQAARSEQAARLRRLDPARVAAAARLRG
jgi:hypothetical protein